MATDTTNIGNKKEELKHLEFVRIAGHNAIILASSVFEFAKQNSRTVRFGVRMTEGTVTTIIVPVCKKFKGVSRELLVILDTKVDKAINEFEKHAPPSAKLVVNQIYFMVQRALELGLALWMMLKASQLTQSLVSALTRGVPEAALDAVNKSAQAVSEAALDVVNKSAQTALDAVNKAQEAAGAVADVANKSAEAAVDAVSKTAETALDVVSKSGEALTGTAEKAMSSILNPLQMVADVVAPTEKNDKSEKNDNKADTSSTHKGFNPFAPLDAIGNVLKGGDPAGK